MGGIRPAPPLATFNQFIMDQLRHDHQALQRQLETTTPEKEHFRIRCEQLETELEQIRTEHNQMKREFEIFKLKMQLNEQTPK
ncbi:unnamed protein product [Rotaria sordida]|uniref:Uncharacterized protein n=2 Tax=Rotaria sordida TaxID=392033 RepID=A0A819JWD0_9BILA|nr:unnamed protein product [Rotaria sordida]